MENTNQAEIKNKVKHFMSVLGTGGYSNANYSLCDDDNRSVKDFHNSRFIQASLFKLRCSDFSDGDRISIFITDESEKKHGEDLRTELKDLIGEKKIALDFVKIKNGMTTSEQWENFNIMYDAIGDCEEITADLTHGFRTLPIQLYTILGYAETLKKITIKGIYYGAFEHTFGYKGEEYVEPAEVSYLKDKRNLTDEEIKEKNRKLSEITQYTPIIDYNEYLEILSLSRAAFVFEETGYADSLVKEANKSFKKHIPEEEYQKLNIHYSMIELVSENIRGVRGGSRSNDKNKSIYHALKAWNNIKGKAGNQESCTSEFKAIENITDYIDDVIETTFSDVFECEDDGSTGRIESIADVKTGIDTVAWCIRYGLVQAGYTALEETVTTWLIAISDDDFYQKVKSECQNEYSENADEECKERCIREKYTNIVNDYNSKNHAGNNISYKEMKLEPLTIEFIDKNQKYDLIEIFDLVKSIKQIRNDLNHFEFSNSTRKVVAIKGKLKNQQEKFVTLINPIKELPKQQEQ